MTETSRDFGFRPLPEIMGHPGFGEACDLLTDGLATLYDGDHRLKRRLVQYTPAVTFMVVASLDAAYRAEDPATFPTLARLTEACAQLNIGGPRRVADLVTGMKLDGYLTREPAPGDRRVHLLRATERMWEADRDWLETFHAPLALLYPDEPAYRPALAHDRGFQGAYRRAGLTTFAVANKIMSAAPAVTFFLGYEVGLAILMVMMKAVRGREPACTPPGFYSAAAERAGVSRTHVRNILRDAAERGLVVLSDPPGRFVEVLPDLAGQVRIWLAESLCGTSYVCSLAHAAEWRDGAWSRP